MGIFGRGNKHQKRGQPGNAGQFASDTRGIDAPNTGGPTTSTNTHGDDPHARATSEQEKMYQRLLELASANARRLHPNPDEAARDPWHTGKTVSGWEESIAASKRGDWRDGDPDDVHRRIAYIERQKQQRANGAKHLERLREQQRTDPAEEKYVRYSDVGTDPGVSTVPEVVDAFGRPVPKQHLTYPIVGEPEGTYSHIRAESTGYGFVGVGDGEAVTFVRTQPEADFPHEVEDWDVPLTETDPDRFAQHLKERYGEGTHLIPVYQHPTQHPKTGEPAAVVTLGDPVRVGEPFPSPLDMVGRGGSNPGFLLLDETQIRQDGFQEMKLAAHTEFEGWAEGRRRRNTSST